MRLPDRISRPEQSTEGQNLVDDLTDTAFLRRPDLHVETQGEFAGWRTWSRDRFESHNGPFWHRMDDDGRVRCAFRVEQNISTASATSTAAAS